MATDGEIDFGVFTRAQLDSAVQRMDRHRYPINYRNLIAEYQRRQIEDAKVAALAAESTDALALETGADRVIEFTAAFGADSGVRSWLAPSRNDFHLVGSGKVRINGDRLLVSGRRYSIFIGLPWMWVVDLSREYVVNVEADGAVIRFDYREPGEAKRGLTVWLANSADAERLAGALQVQRSNDFVPQLQAHVDFEQRLIARAPKTPVTYGLAGICVVLFLTTGIATHRWLSFDPSLLIGVGSNFGPFTTDGDWWRLLTAMFLHVGLLHVAFNMWALVSFGPMVERLYGSVSYLVIYLVAGLAGNLASVSWDPDVNSVGASGAIFGTLGALIAVHVRAGSTIPVSVVRPVRNSSLFYTGFALCAGLASTGVDNAAHLGGVAAGFLMGVALSSVVTGRTGALRVVRAASQALVVTAFLLGVGLWTARLATARLTEEGLFARTIHWYGPRETVAIKRWQSLRSTAKASTLDDNAYASAMESEIVPFWREAVARLEAVDLKPTSPVYGNLQYMLNVTHGRLSAIELTVSALRHHDATTVDRAMRDMRSVDDLIAAKAARAKQQP
jgi:rhomboid protease GluP